MHVFVHNLPLRSDDFDYDGAIGDEELEEFGIKHERNSKGEEIDEDEIAVENDLERFYKRLLDTKFSDVLPDIIKQWEERLENVRIMCFSGVVVDQNVL